MVNRLLDLCTHTGLQFLLTANFLRCRCRHCCRRCCRHRDNFPRRACLLLQHCDLPGKVYRLCVLFRAQHTKSRRRLALRLPKIGRMGLTRRGHGRLQRLECALAPRHPFRAGLLQRRLVAFRGRGNGLVHRLLRLRIVLVVERRQGTVMGPSRGTPGLLGDALRFLFLLPP